MAIAFVQSSSGFNGDANTLTQSITLPSSVASGNTLIVGIAGFTPSVGPTYTVTDTLSNTWTLAAPVYNNTTLYNGNTNVAIYYTVALSGGADTVTVSFTGGGAQNWFFAVAVMEYSGIGSSPVVDQSANNTGTSQIASSSITTTRANELLIAVCCGSNNSSTQSVSGDFTQRENEAESFADSIQSSVGTYTATFNQSISTGWITQIVTFWSGIAGHSLTLLGVGA